MGNNIVKQGQVINLSYGSFGSTKDIVQVITLVDIDLTDLDKSINDFINSSVNSVKCCGDTTCNGFGGLPKDYEFCPYCTQELELEYRVPTIAQFVENNAHKFTKVKAINIPTDFVSD